MSDTCERKTFLRDLVAGSTGAINGSGESFSQRYWGVANEVMAVATVTADEERTRAGAPDLIKIDVEGHEESVIRGAHTTLKEDQPILIFECFHGGGEITDFLESLGYWVGDAEHMNNDRGRATNFLALPPRHRPVLEALRQFWTEQMSQFG